MRVVHALFIERCTYSFQQACQEESSTVCNSNREESSVCNVVSAYVSICKAQEVAVDYPSQCGKTKKDATTFRRRSRILARVRGPGQTRKLQVGPGGPAATCSPNIGCMKTA